MNENIMISDRVRALRGRRGLTQEELAEASGLSLAVVKKIEQGGTARMETYHQLARALGVRTVWFVSPRSPEPADARPDDAVLAEMRAAVDPPVDLAGQPMLGTADGDDLDLNRLRTAVHSVGKHYHDDDYDNVAEFIPALIRSAHLHVAALDSATERQEALRVRANITHLAGRYLIQVLAHDLALTALRASLRDALEIGHRRLAAATVCSQTWAMLRQGRFDEVERLCVKTADQIEPRMSTATPDELAVWGWLLLWAGKAAVRNNRSDSAKDFMAVAGSAGARLKREHPRVDQIPFSDFGPITAAVTGVEVALVAGDPGRALELCENLPRGVGTPSDLTIHRHKLDRARALVRTGHPDEATEILTELRRAVPSWLRYQRYGRDTMREILATRPRMPTEEQRILADFFSIDD